MKRAFLLCAALFAGSEVFGLAQAPGDWQQNYDRLLAKYVSPAGVKYSAWKSNAADMQALQSVVDGIANTKPTGLERSAQLAFYLNAYNAWILHEALAKYPTKSVKDTLFTFFTSNRTRIGGEPMSFNHLEKDVIRGKFAEPRVHFALNCASRSCPPLNPQSFTSDNLESTLEKLAKAFVNSERGVRVGADKKSAELSKVFDWYKDDFKKEGGALAFINKRRIAPLPNDSKISYQEYDWSLNEVK